MPPNRNEVCRRCGQKGHIERDCRNARVYFCWDCGKKDIRTIDCCRKQSSRSRRARARRDSTVPRLTSPANSLRQSWNHILITVTINGRQLEALIDTGTSNNIISEACAAKFRSADIVPCDIDVRMADGFFVNIRQALNAYVCFDDRRYQLQLLILPNSIDSVILGMDFLGRVKATFRVGNVLLQITRPRSRTTSNRHDADRKKGNSSDSNIDDEQPRRETPPQVKVESGNQSMSGETDEPSRSAKRSRSPDNQLKNVSTPQRAQLDLPATGNANKPTSSRIPYEPLRSTPTGSDSPLLLDSDDDAVLSDIKQEILVLPKRSPSVVSVSSSDDAESHERQPKQTSATKTPPACSSTQPIKPQMWLYTGLEELLSLSQKGVPEVLVQEVADSFAKNGDRHRKFMRIVDGVRYRIIISRNGGKIIRKSEGE